MRFTLLRARPNSFGSMTARQDDVRKAASRKAANKEATQENNVPQKITLYNEMIFKLFFCSKIFEKRF